MPFSDSAHGVYQQTIMDRLDGALFRRSWVRRLLIVTVATVLIIPSVQFAAKIHEKEWSALRGREDYNSALGRWLPDAVALVEGGNPYGVKHWFPAPPLVLMGIVPFAYLPITMTAVLWSILKIGAAAGGAWLLIRAYRKSGASISISVMVAAAIFSVRAIMGDITHGNINLFVFFEIALAWCLFVRGRDFWSGLTVGLAIVTKITPGLLLVYFLYKRAWKAAFGAVVGLVLFVWVIPSLVLGVERNNRLLAAWYDQMVAPYAVEGWVTVEEINQSLPGWVMKIAAFPHLVQGTWVARWSAHADERNIPADSPEGQELAQLARLRDKLQKNKILVTWADRIGLAFPTQISNQTLAERTGQPFMARFEKSSQRWIIRGAGLAILLLIVWCSRTPLANRQDVRLLLELSLVLLGMLLLSERTWKHHLTTLPIIYLASWSALACRSWSKRFTIILTVGLVIQFLLLVLLKGDVLLYAGIVTAGLLACLLQNAVLLRRLNAASVLDGRPRGMARLSAL